MSSFRHVALQCNYDSCVAWIDFEESSVRATREKAALKGWAHRWYRDFCPEHRGYAWGDDE